MLLLLKSSYYICATKQYRNVLKVSIKNIIISQGRALLATFQPFASCLHYPFVCNAVCGDILYTKDDNKNDEENSQFRKYIGEQFWGSKVYWSSWWYLHRDIWECRCCKCQCRRRHRITH